MITKQELSEYRDIKDNLIQIEQKITETETKLYSLRSAPLTGMPFSHGVTSGSAQERAADKYSEALDKLRCSYVGQQIKLVQKQEHIEAHLRRLPDRYQVIFRLHYIDGLTWPQVAERKSYSLSQINRYHRKGIKKLALMKDDTK